MFFGCSPCCDTTESVCGCNLVYPVESNLDFSPGVFRIVTIGTMPFFSDAAGFCSYSDLTTWLPASTSFSFKESTLDSFGRTTYTWEGDNSSYISYSPVCPSGYWRFHISFSTTALPSCITSFQSRDFNGTLLTWIPYRLEVEIADLNCQNYNYNPQLRFCDLFTSGQATIDFCTNHARIGIYASEVNQRYGDLYTFTPFQGWINLAVNPLP